MPTSLEDIDEILNQHHIQHKVVNEDGYVSIGSATENYINNDGNHGVSIIIAVDERGKFVKIIAPNLYGNSDFNHHAEILQTCMNITKNIKMIQCYYDESGGEIRIQIEIPVEDQKLSTKQLIRALSCIVETVDSSDKAFRSAIDKGVVITVNIMDKCQETEQITGLMNTATIADLDQLIQQMEFIITSTSNHLQLVKH